LRELLNLQNRHATKRVTDSFKIEIEQLADTLDRMVEQKISVG